jgi:hypothetical protein
MILFFRHFRFDAIAIIIIDIAIIIDSVMPLADISFSYAGHYSASH